MGEIVVPERAVAPVTVADLVSRRDLIEDAMKRAMRPGEHYGTIPGTQKPTLLKPGAEVLCALFALAPRYVVEQQWIGEAGHLFVTATCTLEHIPTGGVVADGTAVCSSMEGRYRWREKKRECPACHAEAIIKGKREYGGGWVCFKKQGGCGAKFDDGDPAIEAQETGRVENPDVADVWNTVVKMAQKRALTAAVLNATAASDVFTQDMEQDASPDRPAENAPVSAQDRPGGDEGGVPGTWAALEVRVDSVTSKGAFKEWLTLALEQEFGQSSVKALSAGERKDVFDRVRAVCAALLDATGVDQTGFGVASVSVEREAWYRVFPKLAESGLVPASKIEFGDGAS